METKIYNVVSSSYETTDNYLHQESFTFTDKDKAREKFNALRGSAKIEIEGDEDSEVEYSSTEDDYENRYQGSREVGTEMEYQVIVELKEVEIEVEMEGNCELEQKLRDKYNMMSEYEGYAHIDDITEFAKEVLVDVLDDDGQDDYVCNDFEEEFHAALCDLIVGLGVKYHKKMKK